jgi:hypothetical protein
MLPLFRTSHPKVEGVFQASKWLFYRVLLDEAEMENLFSSLPPFELYATHGIVSPDEVQFSREEFLAQYGAYVQKLKKGETPIVPKPLFSAAVSATKEAFYQMEVSKGVIVKVAKPIVQLSAHHFNYSSETGDFHFMVHSKEAVEWGLQFSYPQIYSNSHDAEIIEVMKDRTYPNTELFRSLMKWMRSHTRPTPFEIQGKRVNSQARIGNRCFEWIGHHQGLKKVGLVV